MYLSKKPPCSQSSCFIRTMYAITSSKYQSNNFLPILKLVVISWLYMHVTLNVNSKKEKAKAPKKSQWKNAPF